MSVAERGEDRRDRRPGGAPPSGADTPAPEGQRLVDEDTPLRIRPDEKVPPPGDDRPVRVPERAWEENNRRQDTATRLAKDEPPVE